MSLLPAKPQLSFKKSAEEDACFLDVEDRVDWRTEFGNGHPINLEIGFGAGNFLIKMAVREPDKNFIGMDFYFPEKGIRKLMTRIKNLQLKNIRVVCGDVRKKIPLLFQDGALDAVYINFPDPWPKKRHKNRRLIHPAFMKLLAEKLAPAGRISLSTDSPYYAEEILEYGNAEPALQNRDRESGLLPNRGDLPKSSYEKGFIYGGDKIYYLEYFRRTLDREAGHPDKDPSLAADINYTLEKTEAESNDEFLIRKFKSVEANARDACDLKGVADDLADAGDPEWARKIYVKAEERAEDSLDFNWLAGSLCEKLGDREWAAKVYKQAEEKAQCSLDFNWLAYSLCENLGDKQSAEKLYQQAEARAENVRELCDLADSVRDQLGNEEWARKVYKKAESEAKDHSDFYELADHLCENLGDKDWAVKVYQQAGKKAEDCSDLQSLAESLCAKLGDRGWGEKVYQQAEGKAQDSGDFCALADSLCQKLDAREWAEKLYRRAEIEAAASGEFRDLADSVCENLGDREWAGKLYKEAEARARCFYDFRWLAESLCQKLGDKEWAGKVYQQAEQKAKDPSDFNRLAQSRRENLEMG